MGKPKSPIRTASPTLRALLVAVDEAGMTDKAVSERMRVHSARVSEWRRGKHEPTIMYLEHMASVLDMEITVRRKQCAKHT